MTIAEAQIVANPLFDTYPSVNRFFVTSDEQAFEDAHSAYIHAKSMQGNSDVITVWRDAAEGDTQEADAIATEKMEDNAGDEAEKAADTIGEIDAVGLTALPLASEGKKNKAY